MPTLLNDRYELGDVVGSGGMGTVHRAVDTRLGRTVAIKILRGGPLTDETARARMRSEAQLAASIHHPGVAQVFDYSEDLSSDDGMSFIVMQFIEGRSLDVLLRERKALPVEQVMSVVEQAAEGLAVAHAAGIVHRDLKPGNIMLTPEGRTVLVDFGIARSAVSEPITATGSMIGTADYMSPEQVGGRPATPRSDLYALGVVAYQCLTGESPFRRETSIATALAQLNDDLPPLGADVPADARALVEALTAKDPAQRPASAADVARGASMMGAVGTVGPPTPSTPTAAMASPPTEALAATSAMPAPPTSASRRPRRRPMAVFAGISAIVLVLAALGLQRVGSDEDPVAPQATSSTVQVSAKDYIGTPYAEAAAALKDLGLEVRRQDVEQASDAGNVVALDPTGRLDPGSVVTLSVAVAPAAAPSPAPDEVSDTVEPEQAEPEQAEPEKPKPEKPKGKAKDKDKGRGKDKG
ncbi:MAG: protein kinase [Aeromicrobium sp.]